ncbi:glucokinase [Nitratidesulfovibrio liaohensis]|uniref:Glucokinase n=1 Tax=Nitratidesulfovibrio liaohensis TaxID=2604158 RepID=A0ABY9R426_9BACT|nr:glucokinase [Nitratidesulfovibrio liaohensis]WMW66516.1 glucokinase [Nitratidesulfovibrio liaohensis]
MRVLAADIGGTNSRFALYETDALARGHVPRPQDRLCAVRLPTACAASFADLMRRAAVEEPGLFTSPALLVLAVAGPVRGGRRCTPPNIPWGVDLDDPALRAPGMPPLPPVLLINDFVAQAYACVRPAALDVPGVLDMVDVLDGHSVPDAPTAVVGAGTGLGKCLLLPSSGDGMPPRALPSEGGHALFPFTDEREMAFAAFVRAHTGRQVIGDLVVSGPGLRLLHAFHTGQWLEPAEVAARLTTGEGTAGPDQALSQVLSWFARFYGRACRDYVLETLALGGLFIAGGVAAATPVLVTHPAFAEAFRQSDTHAELLRGVPVRLVRGPDAGLLGAALYGALNGVTS